MHDLGTFKKPPSALSDYPVFVRDACLWIAICFVAAWFVYGAGVGFERVNKAQEIAGRV